VLVERGLDGLERALAVGLEDEAVHQ
jgi:hypothetical protein